MVPVWRPAVMILISCINGNINTFKVLMERNSNSIINIFLAYFSGIVVTPVLLPYIPSGYFSLKGFSPGLLIFLLLSILALQEIIYWKKSHGFLLSLQFLHSVP